MKPGTHIYLVIWQMSLMDWQKSMDEAVDGANYGILRGDRYVL